MGFGFFLVEVCDANPASDERVFELEQLDGIAVLETMCMGNCEICSKGPYAIVNGDLLMAPTVPELIQQIRRLLAAEQNATCYPEIDMDTE